MRLDHALSKVSNLSFGGTDCALPMLYATDRRMDVDVFVVLTDSETWAGGVHPVQALRDYREKRGRAAKLIVVGMVSNGFSIADPNDAGMMDVVGFDTNVPSLMADFATE
jgi:60 kDa SS-A/Ro ribonucleoprotein